MGWDVIYERYHMHNDNSTTSKTCVYLQHPAVGPAQHAIEQRTIVSRTTNSGHARRPGMLSHDVAIVG